MRKTVVVLNILVTLLSAMVVCGEDDPVVKAAGVVHDGDLILTGNNVTTIENIVFHINGSIIVMDNATLILRNAVLNFTQTANWQFNMTFKNSSVYGNPKLIVENATIKTNGYGLNVKMDMLYAANAANINGLTATDYISFYILEKTHGTISNSRINFIYMQQNTRLEIANSTINYFYMSDTAECYIYDSCIDYGNAYNDSRAWLINTTIPETHGQVYDNAVVYLCWYLGIHVTDFVGQEVAGANMTAYYLSGTIADTTLTDTDGWGRLTLMAGFVNATGFFPAENYTFTLSYVTVYSHLISLGPTSVQMPNNNINETVSLGFFYSYPASYYEDLYLGDSEFLLVEGLLNMNGSILVVENARLMLDNAWINFTQTSNDQFEMDIMDNAQFIVENSNIMSEYSFSINLQGNSSAITDRLSTTAYFINLLDYSSVSISNSAFPRLYASHYTNISAINCTMRQASLGGNASCTLSSCTINDFISVGATFINATISNLATGHFSSWNFLEDCNVEIAQTGFAPNLTIIDTNVDFGFSFNLFGASNTTISGSTIQWIYCYGKSETEIYNSHLTYALVLYDDAYCHLEDTSTQYGIFLNHNSEAWCFNVTTSYEFHVEENAVAYVGWWLNIHVVDQNSDDIPNANTTIKDSEDHAVALGKTNEYGWAKFGLLEKIVNATGQHLVGNYTVEASYNGYSSNQSVQMDENKIVILQLPFTIPELSPATILLTLFALATAIAHGGKKLKTR